ncbi:MAG TPA: T9SS type A sorting domain-containing protein, partial [Candidatus Krumholzibacteria bacterium]|nr:T9SS type A sorting domain-containing protein [Candidatus Krumholzibacteria bacterium]
PIVFTSQYAPGARASGDWGGVIILGDAPTNKVNPLIEGGLIPGSCSGGGGTYGGTDPSDDSGVFSYVRIEFPGFRFAANNEVNGLTMGGVGGQTQIDHVQVSYSDDDSFEWFGGTVDCSYLVAFGGTDDEFDTDFGFRGDVQFGFGLRDPDQSDPTGESNGFESDNDGSATSTATPYTRPIFSNITLVGPERTNAEVPFPLGETYQYSAVLRRSTQTNIFNSVIMGYPWGLRIRDVNTIAWAGADSLQIRNTSVQATLQPSGSTHIHDETLWTGIDTWFTTGGWNNIGLATRLPSTILLNNLNDLNAPDPRPAAGSELIGSASFASPRLAGFVNTTYRGAFPPVADAAPNELWTYYWTSFDPQTMDYSDGLPTAIGDAGPQYASHLSQNYPNPFNPQTTIDFVVPATGPVTLEVFDARGAKVASLVDGVKSKGNHTVSFNAQGLASGVYFYRLKGTGFNEMRKMVLLK